MKHSLVRACMKIGMVAGVCVMAYAGWQLYKQINEDLQSDTRYADLRDAIVSEQMDMDVFTIETVKPPVSAAVPLPDKYPPIPDAIRDIQIDFAALQKINPEVIAWIYCPDTVIDYPVARGTDNYHYLHYLYDGTRNANGTIFLDYETDPAFTDTNNVLYGHHMKSGKMFATLEKYKSPDFADTHPYFYLFTPRGVYEVELFAGVVKGARKTVPYPNFENETILLDTISGLQADSTFHKDITIQGTDRFLWMITCDYNFKNARYFLVGRLNKIGEWLDEAENDEAVNEEAVNEYEKDQ